MARRRRRPRDPYGPLSEAQLQAELARRLDALMKPMQTQTAAEGAARVAAIRGSSEAAAKLLAEHAGATQQGYDLATKEVQGLGGGYSEEMRAKIAAASQAAQDFSRSQGGTGTGGVDPTAVGDTVYHGGVDIPGSSLASQGAAATALENAQAGIPLLQGAQDIRRSQMDEEKALADLAAKRPELRTQILDELYKREMQKLQARIAQQNANTQASAQDLYASQFGEKVRHNKAGERLSRMRYEESVRAHSAAMQRASAEGRRPNPSLSKAYGYIVDSDGNPILDSSGKHIPVAKSSTAKSAKAKNNAQYGKAVGEAASMWEDSQPGVPPVPVYDDQGKLVNGTPPKHPWTWGTAMNYLMNRYGIPRKKARAALVAAGFNPPSGVQDPTRGPGRG